MDKIDKNLKLNYELQQIKSLLDELKKANTEQLKNEFKIKKNREEIQKIKYENQDIDNQIERNEKEIKILEEKNKILEGKNENIKKIKSRIETIDEKKLDKVKIDDWADEKYLKDYSEIKTDFTDKEAIYDLAYQVLDKWSKEDKKTIEDELNDNTQCEKAYKVAEKLLNNKKIDEKDESNEKDIEKSDFDEKSLYIENLRQNTEKLHKNKEKNNKSIKILNEKIVSLSKEKNDSQEIIQKIAKFNINEKELQKYLKNESLDQEKIKDIIKQIVEIQRSIDLKEKEFTIASDRIIKYINTKIRSNIGDIPQEEIKKLSNIKEQQKVFTNIKSNIVKTKKYIEISNKNKNEEVLNDFYTFCYGNKRNQKDKFKKLYSVIDDDSFIQKIYKLPSYNIQYSHLSYGLLFDIIHIVDLNISKKIKSPTNNLSKLQEVLVKKFETLINNNIPKNDIKYSISDWKDLKNVLNRINNNEINIIDNNLKMYCKTILNNPQKEKNIKKVFKPSLFKKSKNIIKSLWKGVKWPFKKIFKKKE